MLTILQAMFRIERVTVLGLFPAAFSGWILAHISPYITVPGEVSNQYLDRASCSDTFDLNTFARCGVVKR